LRGGPPPLPRRFRPIGRPCATPVPTSAACRCACRPPCDRGSTGRGAPACRRGSRRGSRPPCRFGAAPWQAARGRADEVSRDLAPDMTMAPIQAGPGPSRKDTRLRQKSCALAPRAPYCQRRTGKAKNLSSVASPVAPVQSAHLLDGHPPAHAEVTEQIIGRRLVRLRSLLDTQSTALHATANSLRAQRGEHLLDLLAQEVVDDLEHAVRDVLGLDRAGVGAVHRLVALVDQELQLVLGLLVVGR